jgi:hypothetical protein
MIKAHLEAHRAEIEAHHQQFEPPITPAYNRKTIPIEKLIRLSEKAMEYPWGRMPEKETASAKKKHQGSPDPDAGS